MKPSDYIQVFGLAGRGKCPCKLHAILRRTAKLAFELIVQALSSQASRAPGFGSLVERTEGVDQDFHFVSSRNHLNPLAEGS